MADVKTVSVFKKLVTLLEESDEIHDVCAKYNLGEYDTKISGNTISVESLTGERFPLLLISPMSIGRNLVTTQSVTDKIFDVGVAFLFEQRITDDIEGNYILMDLENGFDEFCKNFRTLENTCTDIDLQNTDFIVPVGVNFRYMTGTIVVRFRKFYT